MDQTCWSWHGRDARSNQGTNGRWLESRMLKTEILEVVIGNGKVLGMIKQWRLRRSEGNEEVKEL